MARRDARLSGPISKNPAGMPADATTTTYRRRLSLLVGALLVQRADDRTKRSRRPQPPNSASDSGRRKPTQPPSEAVEICTKRIRGAPWAPGSTSARHVFISAREWFRHPFGTPSRAGVLKRDGGAFPSAAPPGCVQFTPTRSSAGMARHGAGCAPRRSSRPSNLFSGLRPATTRYLGATALEKPFRQRPQSRWPAPPSRRFGCSDSVTGRL